MNEHVAIKSTDFWGKVVETLQQNWALIEEARDSTYVFFISDVSGVFDEMKFPSNSAAQVALGRNGFKRFGESADLQPFMRPPSPPYHRAVHPNSPIYSSGRFWRS